MFNNIPQNGQEDEDPTSLEVAAWLLTLPHSCALLFGQTNPLNLPGSLKLILLM